MEALKVSSGGAVGLGQGTCSARGQSQEELRHTVEVESRELDDELDLGSGRGDSQVLRLMNWWMEVQCAGSGKAWVGRFEEEEVLFWICWVPAAS